MKKKMIERKNIKKYLIVTGVLALVTIVGAGCGKKNSSKEEKNQNQPTVTVGCDDYTPFSYMDVDGNLTGIDVELATEAFDRMGYKANIEFIDWEEKKQLLQKGTIDCVWSSFTMDGRENEYKWAGPYMKSNQVVAVNIDSEIHTLEDLNGKTIAVQSTTKPEDLFREHDEKLPKFRKVLSVKNRDLLYTFLSKGYVDAIAAHDTSIEQFMENFDMEYRILDEPLLTVGLGVAFDINDDRGLDKELSKTLKEMQSDGTIKKVIEKYLPNAERYLEDQDGK